MRASERVLYDPRLFRGVLVIEANGKPVRLSSVVDSWQAEDFAKLDGALQDAAGRRVTYPVQRRVWLERPRGHSKTSDIAVAVSWFLMAAVGPRLAVVVAADQEQAGILIKAVETLVRLNPPLAAVLKVQAGRIVNRKTGAELKVMSSDLGSSYGLLPSLVVNDETSHWANDADQLFGSLLSSAGKQQHCLMVSICNAGFTGHWSYNVREQAREAFEQHAGWYFRSLPGPMASWIAKATLDEQQRFLPGTEFHRLWLNEWQDAVGDYLDAEALERAVCLPGPRFERENAYHYVAGCDLGVKKDRASLVILGCRRQSGVAELIQVHNWRPPVDLASVETAIRKAHLIFSLTKVRIDTWQAVMLSQGLRRFGIFTDDVHYTSKEQTEQGMSLQNAIEQEKLRLYRDTQLLTDLRRMQVVPNNVGGYKLVADRDRTGHADSGFALALALPAALQLASDVNTEMRKPEPIRQRINPARFGVSFDARGFANTAAGQYAREQRNAQAAKDAARYGI